MARVRDMQGVPAHLEYLKSDDNLRRHPSHCKYADGKGNSRICTCKKCGYYKIHCSSSSKCEFYEDKRINY